MDGGDRVDHRAWQAEQPRTLSDWLALLDAASASPRLAGLQPRTDRESDAAAAQRRPRIHVAIVCASLGAPLLRAEAYTPERVEQQLQDDLIRFVNNPGKMRLDAEDGILDGSRIFQWYRADFHGGIRLDRGLDPSPSAGNQRMQQAATAGLPPRRLEPQSTDVPVEPLQAARRYSEAPENADREIDQHDAPRRPGADRGRCSSMIGRLGSNAPHNQKSRRRQSITHQGDETGAGNRGLRECALGHADQIIGNQGVRMQETEQIARGLPRARFI